MYSLCIILNMQRKRLNHLLDFSCSKLNSIIFFLLMCFIWYLLWRVQLDIGLILVFHKKGSLEGWS